MGDVLLHHAPPTGSGRGAAWKRTDIGDREIGGRTRTRTLDPLIKSQLLYQLSYAPQPLAEAGV